MVMVAFIFSITASLGKVAITHSSPLFFAILYPAVMSLCLFPIMADKPERLTVLKSVRFHKQFLLIGFLYALMFILHNLAIIQIEVAYMICVKRIHLLFGVFYGWLFFKEVQIRQRLLGSIIMILGVILITVF